MEFYMTFITDFETLFERFAILTTKGKMSDNDAIDMLRMSAMPKLIKQLEEEVGRINGIKKI